MKKIGMLLIAAILALSLTACIFDNDASVGIIGGADGPTAILVTEK